MKSAQKVLPVVAACMPMMDCFAISNDHDAIQALHEGEYPFPEVAWLGVDRRNLDEIAEILDDEGVEVVIDGRRMVFPETPGYTLFA